MATDGQSDFDHRSLLASIAGDASATAASRLRALRMLRQPEPKGRGNPPRVSDEDQIIGRAAELMVEWAAQADAMPSCELHGPGIPVHRYQTPERVATVVRPSIDRALATTAPLKLLAIAADCREPPEARVLASAMYQAAAEQRSAAHEARLGGMAQIQASVAGLLTLRWLHPRFYCSLLDIWEGATNAPARRPAAMARQFEAAAERWA